jgi:FAD/FMN-containing dehydrogenase
MHRRQVLKGTAAIALQPVLWSRFSAWAAIAGVASRRVRPSDLSWPTAASWEKLKRQVGGNLVQPKPLLAACQADANGAPCLDALKNLKNPYYIGDQPAGTQSSGWLDAWTPAPSAYAVVARDAADVAAAVNFARENNLRLVVKGGGHSYQGTSNAADSLLVWTRKMNKIVLHDGFVGQGCAGVQAPQPAATIEAGAVWMDAYDAVTTVGGRYVQGGGCATVGVAGLIQSGGFGSFSKGYGSAAAGLLEAEIVTADGVVRIANACTNPDLFWAIKGGGGGSWGVVTRLTLRTRELPDCFGSADGTIKAASDDAFHALIARFVSFYSDNLFNPHWGEHIAIRKSNTLQISMECQGIDKEQAAKTWQPFFDWVRASPQDYTVTSPLQTDCMPARHYWNARYLKETGDTSYVSDLRPGAPEKHIWWVGDQDQVGEFWHAYESLWLPSSLLRTEQQKSLADALFAASRDWSVGLHFNKGLAGAPAEAVAAAKDTATNPAMLDAFALAIISGGGPPAYPGLAGPAPDLAAAHKKVGEVDGAMNELRKVAPNAGSYVSESNYFEPSWQRSFWGDNYPRLRAVKAKYDPDGLFFVHHGVGSEDWSADGFTRLPAL